MLAFAGLPSIGALASAATKCPPLGPPINTDIPSSGGPVGWVAVAVATLALVFVALLSRHRHTRNRGLAALLTAALLASLSIGISPSDAAVRSQACPPGGNSNVRLDTDGDGLPDANERRFGSDPNKADTDGDGLSDTDEVRTLTDPRKVDTDGDGIGDAQDDTDDDGLSNLSEVRGVTSPADEDSDNDGLNDGSERKHKTDPTNPDTDGDGVKDGDEVALGSDPLKAVENQKYTVKIANQKLGASASVTGPAAAVLTAKVVSAKTELGNIAGGIGSPVAVVSSGTLTSGTLNFRVDPAAIPAGNLAVLHFNEKTGTLDQPKSQSVDRTTGAVSLTTNSFSPFVLVNLDEFEKVWKSELDLPRTGASKNVASMLAIDSSGSMLDNDPQDLRKSAAKQFVDALISGDLAGGVDFDSVVAGFQPLTSDFQLVKSFIDTIDSSGGTDIGVAVSASLDELDRGAGAKRARIIVLLTDGDGSYDDSLTTRAADSHTTIYTVGLGPGVQDALLQGIADGTGGKYFKIADAGGLVDAYKDIVGDIGSPDTDGDGISDKAETDGWRTQRGVVYKTDPAKADTDGDGLDDGEEAGAITTSSWGKAYAGVSDPTRLDTDGDGLDDGSEVEGGTGVWSTDTDGDGLDDLGEIQLSSDPLSANADGDHLNDLQEKNAHSDPNVYDLTTLEGGGALVGGAVFGDWEWGAQHIGRLNDDQRSSWQYLTGSSISGFLAIGDIRDIAVNLLKLDVGATLISVVALVPVLGDAGKVGDSTLVFAKKGGKATRAALLFIAKNPKLGEGTQQRLIKAIVRFSGKKALLARDAAVAGSKAPKRLPLGRPIGKSVTQNAKKDEIVETLRDQGYRDIRVNQQQINADGARVGINRPDIQGTAPDGTRHYYELDTKASERGPNHMVRILTNDLSGEVHLLTVD